MEKSSKPHPVFYARCFPLLQEISKQHGYNLILHGSLNRDFDLVAIPWIDKPSGHLALLQEISIEINGKEEEVPESLKGRVTLKNHNFMHTLLPGGRDAYVININRGGKYNNYVDMQMYLDTSITPLINTHEDI